MKNAFLLQKLDIGASEHKHSYFRAALIKLATINPDATIEYNGESHAIAAVMHNFGISPEVTPEIQELMDICPDDEGELHAICTRKTTEYLKYLQAHHRRNSLPELIAMSQKELQIILIKLATANPVATIEFNGKRHTIKTIVESLGISTEITDQIEQLIRMYPSDESELIALSTRKLAEYLQLQAVFFHKENVSLEGIAESLSAAEEKRQSKSQGAIRRLELNIKHLLDVLKDHESHNIWRAEFLTIFGRPLPRALKNLLSGSDLDNLAHVDKDPNILHRRLSKVAGPLAARSPLQTLDANRKRKADHNPSTMTLRPRLMHQ